MEDYSAIKNNELIKFAGNWTDLENFILSEVTQSQKYTWYVFIYKWILGRVWNTPDTIHGQHES